MMSGGGAGISGGERGGGGSGESSMAEVGEVKDPSFHSQK